MGQKDLLKTARILARHGEQNRLIELLERADLWRDLDDASGAVTEQEIIDALGGRPILVGWPDRTTTIELDASGNDVDKALPSAQSGTVDLVRVRRMDQSGHTAKVSDPDGTDIYRQHDTNSPELDLPPLGRSVLYRNPTPGGLLAWHVLPDTTLYRRAGSWPGQPSPAFPVARWPVDDAWTYYKLIWNAGTAPSGTVTLTAEVEGGTTFSSVSLSGSSTSDTFSVSVSAGDVIRFEIGSYDPDLRNLSWMLLAR